MRAKDIIVVILALIAAVLLALVVRSILTPNAKPTDTNPKFMNVLVLRTDVRKGSAIDPTMFTWKRAPSDLRSNDLYIQGQSDLSELNGAIVREDLPGNAPILRSKLILFKDRSKLAKMLSPGKRALSFTIDPAGSDSGLVIPGDWVDIVKAPEKSNYGAARDNASVGETIAFNIRILALDQRLVGMVDPKNPNPIPRIVTVEVTPDQAEKIANFAKGNTMALSLRGLRDGGEGGCMDAETCTPEAATDGSRPVLKILRGKKGQQ